LHCLNDELPPRSKALLDTMIGPLYVWRPFMSHSYRDPRILYTFLRRTEDNTALLRELRRYELTHILIAGELPRYDPPAPPLTDEQYERLAQFIAEHLRLVRQFGDQRLFEIVE
ncbi:hypothetical protein FJY63_11605, partial [Candidatus Sumerlaeota bacterium]|nr:hypothetical protein [Candidatus Sumerlaeota bacterium]